MSADREIELKLDVSPADLARLPRHPLVQGLSRERAVTRTLDSVYFDTPDDDLARHGFALRVRRVGSLRVQTAKGERSARGGLFERSEVEGPIDADAPDLARLPDRALAERLSEIAAGKPLTPVFATSFRRSTRVLHDGASTWTLEVDEGEIRAGDARLPVHEVELELRAGEPAKLFEFALMLQEHFDVVPATRSKAERGYALARGRPIAAVRAERIALAPDATVEAAMEAIVGQCVAQLAANAECACEGSDPEGVHQMRVGIRRARAALALFRPLLPPASIQLFRSELRWLARELGGARDLDVFTRETLAALEPELGEEAPFKRLREEAFALRAELYQRVREVLRSPRHARLVLELGAWLSGRTWRNQPLSETAAELFSPARDFAAALLERRHRKVRRLAARLDESVEARHALRIQLKKLRYSGEFFRDLFPEGRPGRTLKRVARMQTTLGRMNDVATAHGILETLLTRVGDERTPTHDRVAGFIEGWTAREASAEQAEAGRAWRRLGRTRPFWRS